MIVAAATYMSPVAWRECTTCIDVCDPESVAHRCLNDPSQQCGASGSLRTQQLGEASAGNTIGWEEGVEGGYAGGDPFGAGFSRCHALDHLRDLLS